MVIEMLSNGRERPRVNPVSRRSTLDINGQTSVVALGRPLWCGTLDELVGQICESCPCLRNLGI